MGTKAVIAEETTQDPDEEVITDGTDPGTADDTEQEVSGADDAEGQEGAAEGTEQEGLLITIGDEAPPASEDEQSAPQWVRDLRKRERELARQNRELQAALAQQRPGRVEVGEEPTLQSCEFDGDRFKVEYASWLQRKTQADQQQQAAVEQARRAEAEWQATLQQYGAKKAALAAQVKDVDAAEDAVKVAFNTVQQGILLTGAQQPEILVYALGKNPQKLAELAAIQDPVKFTFALARLEKDLKVQPRKKVPPPAEERVQGSAPALSSDAQLNKLRAEAERTGDYSKVTQYKNRMKAAKR